MAEEDAEQCVGGDGGGGPGEQAPEGVRAVAGQFHLNGDLAEGGLDAVASSVVLPMTITSWPSRTPLGER